MGMFRMLLMLLLSTREYGLQRRGLCAEGDACRYIADRQDEFDVAV